MSTRRSILDDLGSEITGVAGPVSLCMAITVLLVRLLNPDGSSDSGAVMIATAYYSENEGDSTGEKISGAVINAIIFVSVVTLMTFVLVMLFKYGCTKFIYGYMGFAGFSIFFMLTGVIALELLQLAEIHLDWISFTYILYNFAVVGSVTLFFFPAPLLMKQCYLIVTGVATAFVFTWIPEWTTWILLVAMALYDLAAVLMPGGPLKVLVELAQERDEEIPALVYQARSTNQNDEARLRSFHLRQQQRAYQQQQRNELVPEQLPTETNPPPQQQQRDAEEAALPSTPHSLSSVSRDSPINEQPDTPLMSPHTAPSLPPHGSEIYSAGDHDQHAPDSDATSDDESLGLPDAIKLGLGDFIFYSVLVGRAAMYDMLTVFSCYIAIVAGLGCTLLWLAIAHKALPALPISIALAVSFYFISRFVMEPVVLPMVLQLVYF